MQNEHVTTAPATIFLAPPHARAPPIAMCAVNALAQNMDVASPYPAHTGSDWVKCLQIKHRDQQGAQHIHTLSNHNTITHHSPDFPRWHEHWNCWRDHEMAKRRMDARRERVRATQDSMKIEMEKRKLNFYPHLFCINKYSKCVNANGKWMCSSSFRFTQTENQTYFPVLFAGKRWLGGRACIWRHQKFNESKWLSFVFCQAILITLISFTTNATCADLHKWSHSLHLFAA